MVSKEEQRKFTEDIIRGMALSEYRMLRDKAKRNQTVIQSDGDSGWREVSARELFVRLYHEPVPTF